MSERSDQLLAFYKQYRISDQLAFYSHRRAQSDRASDQALMLSAVLLISAAMAIALGQVFRIAPWGSLAWYTWWDSLAAVLPAIAAAIVAYRGLFAYDQQSMLYSSASLSLQAVSFPRPDSNFPQARPSAEENTAELIRRVEAVLRQEQAQEAPTLSQFQSDDETEG